MKSSTLKQRQQTELAALKKKHGILHPEHVVAFAEHPETACHQFFPWDNVDAAHQHRLNLARKLIVSVRVLTKDMIDHQVYVSLKSDRYGSGGYRNMVEVLSDAAMREELLNQAIEEIEYWQEQYDELLELAEIFKAVRSVKRKQTRKKPTPKKKPPRKKKKR